MITAQSLPADACALLPVGAVLLRCPNALFTAPPDRRPPQPELGGSSHRPRHPRLRCEEVLDGLINEYRAVAKKAMVTAVIEYLHPTGLAELNLADRGLGL